MTEDIKTEFKRQFIPDLNREIIAFANTEGGSIYIGIDDDGNVTGIDNIVAAELQCSQHISNTIKPDITMFVAYERLKMDGKDVLKINVNRGSMCPYYISSKGIRPEGVFIRVNSSSVPAPESVILNMIKENSGTSYESTRSLNQNLTFIEAQAAFDKIGLPFGEAQKKTLGLTGDDGLYTNLALLLSDQCPQSIKFAFFQGKTKEIFKDRHEFSGSIFRQMADLLDTIDRYNKLESPKLEGIFRHDFRDYPEEAVREAVLNSIIHRDYSLNGYTLVSIFDDRIEIISLGGLLRGVDMKDILMGVSVLRNPELARVFYMLRLIEAYGTGISKIQSAYESNAGKPLFECAPNSFKVTLPKLSAISGSGQEYSDLEETVIKLIREKGSITREAVENELSTSQATATRLLKKLLEQQKIHKKGQGRSTLYTL